MFWRATAKSFIQVFHFASRRARRSRRSEPYARAFRRGHYQIKERHRHECVFIGGPGYLSRRDEMLRKTMIALCTVASVAMLAPNLALARGGGGGGGGGGHGGGGGGGGGHGGGFGGGGFGGGGGHAGGFGGGGGGFARGGGFGGGGNFGGARGFSGGNFSNSFARGAPVGAAVGVGAVQGGRFANGSFNRGSFNHGRFDHGFRGRRFFVGGFGGYGGYWDYPDYAYDDSYYDDGGYNGGCYIVQQRVHTSRGWRVRPIQVCG
jgi:hypothetical protein